MVYTSSIKLDYVPEGNGVSEFLKPKFVKDLSKPAFTDALTGESITHGQLRDGILRLATILKEKYGVKRDSVVCLFLHNDVYTALIHHAILSLGAIVSPANIAYNASEISHQISMTHPALVVADESVFKTAEDGLTLAKTSSQLVSFTEFRKDAQRAAKDSSIAKSPIENVNGKEQHAYYCFSSGTSGLPKCVITTHTNVSVNMLQLVAHDTYCALVDATAGAVLPLSHIFGLQVYIWGCPHMNNHVVVFKSFQLEPTLQAIVKYKIESMAVVPPLVLALAKHPLVDKYPIQKYLKYCASGAAPLSKSTITSAEKRLPPLKFVQLYGQTETSPLTFGAAQLSDRAQLERYDQGSIGWLAAGTEARIVDPETLEDVKQGERGELWIRGPQVMLGYLHNKVATDDCLLPDKWLRTGDVCIVSDDEQFTVVDRIKELIKSKGHQVAPAELEGLLLKYPEVIDVAVIGVKDSEGVTELPRAYVVLKEGSDVEALAKTFNQSVAIHKRLWGGIVILDAIPKSASGKILRRTLRDNAAKDKAVAVPKSSRM